MLSIYRVYNLELILPTKMLNIHIMDLILTQFQ